MHAQLAIMHAQIQVGVNPIYGCCPQASRGDLGVIEPSECGFEAFLKS